MSKRDWTKLDDSWQHNRKVKKLMRKYGPVAGAYWASIIARTHRTSHHIDNPSGAIHCTLQDLSDELMDRHIRTELFADMVAAKLITITGKGWREDSEADVTLQVCDTSWLNPKGSESWRQRNAREKRRDLQGGVTGASRVGHGLSQSVTQTETKTETKTETRKQDQKTVPAADPASWLNSDVTHIPQPTDPMIAFIDQMRSILMDAYQESSAGQLAEAVYRMSAKRGPMTTTYPDEQWMRAAQELVKAIKDGRIENPSKGAAWIRAAVPTAVGELDTVDGVGEPAEDPDVVRVREMAARYNTEGAA